MAGVLASGPRVVQAAGIVWNEPEKPAAGARTTTARFVLKVESLSLSGQPVPPGMLVNVSWAGAMPAYGDRVSLVGSASNLEERRNPGQFDFAG